MQLLVIMKILIMSLLDLENARIFQNPNPLNLTYRDVKKFDLQNPIIGKLATQVKASKLTKDQLTKKKLIQDQIANIENRLEELKKPININDNSDDDTGGSVEVEAMAEAIMTLHLDCLVEMNLTN